MVAQQSYFTPAEIAWLRERYRADDVQTIIKKGGNFIVNTTKHVLPDFKTLFATARPAETDEEFEKRQAEAEIDERPSLVRREAETETDAKARLDEAYTQIHKYLKGRHHKEKRKYTANPMPSLPELAPARRSKISASQVFAQSSERFAAMPEWPKLPSGKADVGKGQTMLAALWAAQPQDVKDRMLAHAQELNALAAAAELEDAGTPEEIVRAALVPSARDWVKRVIGHLRKEVHWLGGVLIGGPNEHGIVEFLDASTGTNSRGKQYLDALASEIGWSVDRLKTWSMAWLHDALQQDALERTGTSTFAQPNPGSAADEATPDLNIAEQPGPATPPNAARTPERDDGQRVARSSEASSTPPVTPGHGWATPAVEVEDSLRARASDASDAEDGAQTTEPAAPEPFAQTLGSSVSGSPTGSREAGDDHPGAVEDDVNDDAVASKKGPKKAGTKKASLKKGNTKKAAPETAPENADPKKVKTVPPKRVRRATEGVSAAPANINVAIAEPDSPLGSGAADGAASNALRPSSMSSREAAAESPVAVLASNTEERCASDLEQEESMGTVASAEEPRAELAPDTIATPKKAARTQKKAAAAGKKATAGAKDKVAPKARKRTGARTAADEDAAAEASPAKTRPPIVPHPGLDTNVSSRSSIAEASQPGPVSRTGRVSKPSARSLNEDPVMTLAESRRAVRARSAVEAETPVAGKTSKRGRRG